MGKKGCSLLVPVQRREMVFVDSSRMHFNLVPDHMVERSETLVLVLITIE